MPNAFSKEEMVAFDQMIEGFQDALVLSKNVSKYQTNGTDMERASDIIWRPQPYIARSFDGLDQTANFADQTQLSVPATLGFNKSSPWQMDAKELRDALQEGRLGDAAKQKLTSDINVALMNVASLQGTIVVKRTAAASGYDDIALADAAMSEIGVQMDNRAIALSPRDYNSMAGNLAQRQNVVGKVQTAYDRAHVGVIAGFDTFKMDYALRQALAVPGAGVTINGANQRYVPRATSTAGTGERNNVDNRYQTLNVTVGAAGAIKAGDAFTIPGVESVHLITKQATGQLKTFRIISITSGGGTAGANVVVISPPIIAADSAPTVAEQQYKNVSATPASGATLTFLNTATATMNPFWHKDALEILPGKLAIPSDAGMATMSATTDNGITVSMSKQISVNNLLTKYRMDVLFGVVCKQPEMSGIMMFSQP
ncbi:MAG: P22 phage major capsid protein family protein [Pseudomonadota bacterium]